MFLCHRSPDRRWYPDVWDLPGGHVEEGERPETALCRELSEELGITLRPPIGEPVAVVSDTAELHLAVYVVRDWEGAPINRAPDEHDKIGWFDEDGLEPLRLALPALDGPAPGHPDPLSRTTRTPGTGARPGRPN